MTTLHRRTAVRPHAILVAIFLLASPSLPAQQSAPKAEGDPKPKAGAGAQARDSAKSPPRARRDRPGFYKGRQIADVMSWQGVDWLFRETRIEEEQPEAMLDALKVVPGSTVADVGAGAGYHTLRLARRVGPGGTVLATDVQREMIRMLRENVRAARVTNVKPLLATQADTMLPAGKVDLILMVDVYHECTDPEALLLGLRKALRPGGRLVLVEFRGEDPEVPIKPEHKMTIRQVRLEVEPLGFTFRDSLEFLPWQHIIIFEKPADEDSKAKAAGERNQARPPAPRARPESARTEGP